MRICSLKLCEMQILFADALAHPHPGIRTLLNSIFLRKIDPSGIPLPNHDVFVNGALIVYHFLFFFDSFVNESFIGGTRIHSKHPF